MISLAICAGAEQVGTLEHDTSTGLYDFRYAASWCEQRQAFPLSPQIPLPGGRSVGQASFDALPAEQRSVIVRSFFQNLLPEGQALEVAAQTNGISKSNLAGLLLALGGETAGALRVALPESLAAQSPAAAASMRELPLAELSARIRSRDSSPFSVWDGKVRLSIAGLQDKVAVFEQGQALYLVDGARLASTVILKPAPNDPRFADLPLIEHACMQLAAELGINAAATRLLHVPEPVLLVQRFDRQLGRDDAGQTVVERLHIVDACQALGLGPEAKYESLYGDGADVRHIRDGAQLAQLFTLAAQGPSPLQTRLEMLDRVLFNLITGNSDAHGKNWSFFVGPGAGLLRLAPAYDLVDVDAFEGANMSTSLAMAIGDAFSLEEITAFEMASMAKQCDLPTPLVGRRIDHLALAAPRALAGLHDKLVRDGVRPEVLALLAERLARRCAVLKERTRNAHKIPSDLL